MAVTMKKVREVLDPEEPDYPRGVALGPEALPHLEALVNSGDPMLASKATYLASLIEGERSAEIVEQAARSSDPIVRVAAAAAAPNLRSGASDLLRQLASDPDPGVRKVAQSRSRQRTVPPSEGPDAGASQDSVRERSPIIMGRMPGEEDTADTATGGATMLGESTRGMPGERQERTRGLMPGEKPGGSTGTGGEMPR